MAAFAHTSVSGLRTRILGEKPSTGVLKPKLSRPRQDASFSTRFGPASSDFSINLPAKSSSATLSGDATKAGISIGISDMIIPKEKQTELENAYKQIRQVEQQYRRGIITDGERYNKIIDIWTHAGDEISNIMFRTLEHNEGRKELNPVYLMVDSGARGNRQQVRQLAGMRGLMAKPSGEILEHPITSNFREGLSVLEYFISTHGARKGLADTALKTADSGYLTRKLVDAAQDVIINAEDCGTVNGIVVRSIYEGDEEVVDLGQRIIGRVS